LNGRKQGHRWVPRTSDPPDKVPEEEERELGAASALRGKRACGRGKYKQKLKQYLPKVYDLERETGPS